MPRVIPRTASVVLCFIVVFACGRPASAHFLVLLPSHDVVGPGETPEIVLQMQFTHPMEQGPMMPMARPRGCDVFLGDAKTDLLPGLQEHRSGKVSSYSVRYRFTEPGDYVFTVSPAPYWEPAERKWIIHYTKVAVNFLGNEGGWEQPVGLPVEIQPLARPYGLWTGNVFRGIVLRDGKPVPFAAVEVEYWNEGGRVAPPNDAYVTQVIKADAAGVFCYAMPRAGWWGFAALVDGTERLPDPEGTPADVELGGLIWVRTSDMK
ncbi:MAG: DUF4198 domain-containing protein [Thermogutta sp.]